MALKDWRKVGKDQWNRKGNYINLAIEPDKNGFVVMAENYKTYEAILVKHIRTKIYADRYAKLYRKKH